MVLPLFPANGMVIVGPRATVVDDVLLVEVDDVVLDVSVVVLLTSLSSEGAEDGRDGMDGRDGTGGGRDGTGGNDGTGGIEGIAGTVGIGGKVGIFGNVGMTGSDGTGGGPEPPLQVWPFGQQRPPATQ